MLLSTYLHIEAKVTSVRLPDCRVEKTRVKMVMEVLKCMPCVAMQCYCSMYI